MTYSRYFLCLAMLFGLALSGRGQAQKTSVQKALVKRTYYDYAKQHLHEEYQYTSTVTNRYCKNGYYKEYNEDGTLWRKQFFRNDKNEGRQLEYFTSDGETWLQYDITVRNNLMNGPYIRYSGPGEKMSAGSHVNSERTGQWKFYYPEGYEVCTYRADKKEGPATLFYKSGQVAEQYAYRHDERYDDGDVKGFYEDGSPKKSGHFTDGDMDGKFLAWYPNGQLRYEENYVAGLREGRVLAYDEQGSLIADDVYHDDVLVNHKKSASEVAQEVEEAAHEAQRQRAQQSRDSVMQAAEDQESRAQKTLDITSQANSLVRDAMIRQEFMRNEAAVGRRARLPRRLYIDLYDQLLADYQAADAADAPAKLAKATRLKKLLDLAVAVENGQQAALGKAIRQETDLNKVLALTGL